MRANRLRSFLTLLGIIIGVATLVGVVSVIPGLNGFVQEKVIQLSPDVYVVHEVRDHPQPRGVPRRAQAARTSTGTTTHALSRPAAQAEQVAAEAVGTTRRSSTATRRLADIQVQGTTANYGAHA